MHLTSLDHDKLKFAKFLLFRYLIMKRFPVLTKWFPFSRTTRIGTLLMLRYLDMRYFKDRLARVREDAQVIPFQKRKNYRFYFQEFEAFMKFQERQPLLKKMEAIKKTFDERYPRLL